VIGIWPREVLLESPLFLSIIATLGLLLGSFLNVVIVRLPHDRSLNKPSSHCPKCGHKLSWYENIPVVSYSVLKGKCRSCDKPISPRYPLVEILTSVLLVASVLVHGFSILWIFRDLFFVCALIAIIFIDIDHRIIPDELSLGGLVLGLITAWWELSDDGIGFSLSSGLASCLGAAIGFGIFYGIAWFYERRTGRMGLGGGDIKLLAMMGAFLGLQGVFDVIFISSLTGALTGIAMALIKRKSLKEVGLMSLPFGPFMVLGAFYHYFLAGDLGPAIHFMP